MLKINVTPYNPEWPSHFLQIREGLNEALSDFFPSDRYEIKHVGSTSIPGLAAKPIIDIDIIVAAEDIMEATMALTSHGYTYAYEPNGIDRMVFRFNKHKLDSGASTPTEDGTPRRAVYLNKKDSSALLNHLVVQKRLMEDEAIRKEYGDLKLELAKEEHDYIGDYGGKKNSVLQRILNESGLSPEEMQRIRVRPKHKIDKIINEERRRAREAEAAATTQQ